MWLCLIAVGDPILTSNETKLQKKNQAPFYRFSTCYVFAQHERGLTLAVYGVYRATQYVIIQTPDDE